MVDSIRPADETPTPSSPNGPLSEEDAFDAFMALDPDASEEKPSKEEVKTKKRSAKKEEANDASEDADETTEVDEDDDDQEADDQDDDAETDDDETDEDDEEEDADEAEPTKASDEDVVEIKIGDDVSSVSVKDLKRLYGQEATLTKKSQQASKQIKQAETREAAAHDILQKLYTAALERHKQYEGLDLIKLAASGDYAAEDILAAREGMDQSAKEVAYFTQTLDQFQSTRDRTSKEALKEKATAALAVIQDETSEFHIEGFAEKYPAMLTFATKAGIPSEVLENTADAWLWKLLDNNMRYTAAKTKLKEAPKKQTNKVSAKKVLKSKRQAREALSDKGDKTSKALDRLRKNGSSEDAAINAFLSLDS